MTYTSTKQWAEKRDALRRAATVSLQGQLLGEVIVGVASPDLEKECRLIMGSGKELKFSVSSDCEAGIFSSTPYLTWEVIET